jgi:ribosomal protein L15
MVLVRELQRAEVIRDRDHDRVSLSQEVLREGRCPCIVEFRNDEVNPQSLIEAGLIKKSQKQIKILGRGELNIPLTVKAHKISQSAQNKIIKAGGHVEIISK